MNQVESQLGSSHMYTMRELNQRTAKVIEEINESEEPAAITRHGRFVALIYPLANSGIESTAISRIIESAENAAHLRGDIPLEHAKTPEEIAADLGVNL